MSRVTVRLDRRIDAPAERTFDQATDLVAYNEWMPTNGVFKRVELLSHGPVGPGTTYVDRGRTGAFAGKVVEYRRPSRVRYDERLRWWGRPVVDTRITYEFEQTPDGTIVHHEAESEFHGIFRLVGPALARMIGPGERRRTLDGLKRSTELMAAEASDAAAASDTKGEAPACPWPPPGQDEEARRAA